MNQHEELLFEHHEESRVMHEAGKGVYGNTQEYNEAADY